MNDLHRLESMLCRARRGLKQECWQTFYSLINPRPIRRTLRCHSSIPALGASPQTLAQLATAEAWATQEGLTHIATRTARRSLRSAVTRGSHRRASAGDRPRDG